MEGTFTIYGPATETLNELRHFDELKPRAKAIEHIDYLKANGYSLSGLYTIDGAIEVCGSDHNNTPVAIIFTPAE